MGNQAKVNSLQIDQFKGQLRQLGSEISLCSETVEKTIKGTLSDSFRNDKIIEAFNGMSSEINSLKNSWESIQTETIDSLNQIKDNIESDLSKAVEELNSVVGIDPTMRNFIKNSKVN